MRSEINSEINLESAVAFHYDLKTRYLLHSHYNSMCMHVYI